MSKGITTIKKSMLDFFEIKEHDIYVSNKKGAKDLSDFESSMLELVGNAIRPENSQHFWCDGAYSWYRNEKQEKKDRVWLTKNGIAIYERETENGNYELFRIRFDF